MSSEVLSTADKERYYEQICEQIVRAETHLMRLMAQRKLLAEQLGLIREAPPQWAVKSDMELTKDTRTALGRAVRSWHGSSAACTTAAGLSCDFRATGMESCPGGGTVARPYIFCGTLPQNCVRCFGGDVTRRAQSPERGRLLRLLNPPPAGVLPARAAARRCWIAAVAIAQALVCYQSQCPFRRPWERRGGLEVRCGRCVSGRSTGAGRGVPASHPVQRLRHRTDPKPSGAATGCLISPVAGFVAHGTASVSDNGPAGSS